MSGPPDRLGDYQRLERIGAGGMAEVYRARHPTTGAEYALKLLPPAQDPQLALRFQREGRALAALGGHPNIVRVHSAGVEQGWLYLVQELVPGGDLMDRLRSGPLPPEVARRLAIELGRGLDHAHAHGILHRDLKPANVLLASDGQPRLVDFGLAQVADGGDLTETGAVLGSPNWMSPEQALSQPIEERSDVYGLGAVLYHCLTGRPPAEGGSILTVLDRVATAPPPRPRDLVPDIPPALEAICLKALSKRPADRYASASDFVQALETGKAPRRRGAAIAIAVAATLLGLGGLLALSTLTAPEHTVDPRTPDTPDAVPGAPTNSAADSQVWSKATIEDPALWRSARRGDRAACLRLGLLCKTASRPAEAARFLKRAGRPLDRWTDLRDSILEQAWAADPRERLDLVWFLLAPAGQDFPTPTSDRSTDPVDLRAAARLLKAFPKTQSFELRRRRLQTYLSSRPVGQTSEPARADLFELITKHPQLTDHYREQVLGDSSLGLQNRRELLERHAITCNTRFPERSLEAWLELLKDDGCERSLREAAVRSVVLLLETARTRYPDLRNAELLRRWAREGVQTYAEPYSTRALLQELITAEAPPEQGEIAAVKLAIKHLLGQRDLKAHLVEWRRTAHLGLAEALLRLGVNGRRRARILLRERSSVLTRVGRPDELKRLLRLWAKAEGWQKGFLVKLERSLANAPTWERILGLLKRAALPVSTGAPRADPVLWRAARQGEPAVCEALGLDLLAGNEPIEAARWLKRAGIQVWRAQRARVKAAVKPLGLRDRRALHLAQVLLRPAGVEYAGPRRFLTQDARDRAWAITLLQRVKSRKNGARPKLAESLQAELRLSPKQQRKRVVEATGIGLAPSPFVLRSALEQNLREAREGGSSNLIRLARARLAKELHESFPERALELYRALADNELRPNSDPRPSFVFDQVLRLLEGARPDTHDAKAQRRYAIRGLRYRVGRSLDFLRSLLDRKVPLTRPELKAIRVNLSAGLQAARKPSVRGRIANLQARAYLLDPPDPERARRALHLVAAEVHSTQLLKPLRQLIRSWVLTLPRKQQTPWKRRLIPPPSWEEHVKVAKELGLLR